MVENDQEWLSCLEACEQLGITLNNLRQLQQRGRIKWKKRSGRNVYYLAVDVQALAEERRSRNYG